MNEHTSEARDNITEIDPALLRAWPLPMPSSDGDKEQRGRVLIVGGSSEMPGAAILAATAALRAGAGKVTVATGAGVAQAVALAVPESRVIALPESDDGAVAATAAYAVNGLTGKIDAVLIGPGMQNESALTGFVAELLPQLDGAPVLLDACAMGVVRNAAGGKSDGRFLGRFALHVLLTPHAGEMAHLCGMGKEQVAADPVRAAREAAQRWQAVVALKGAATVIATPDDAVWRHCGGNIGLAVSGSGDTLAGIMVALAARGASLEQAAAWGVALHAAAGDLLARRSGPLGFLARELAAEVPALMHAMAAQPAPA
jgi:ADP-dependent NAD(P)H-hydrate dehydratase